MIEGVNTLAHYAWPDGSPQSAFWVLFEPRKKQALIQDNLARNRERLGIKPRNLKRHSRLTR